MWTWEFPTNDLVWSSGLYRLFGLEPGSVQPTREYFHGLIHPDDRPLQLQRAQAMRDGLALSFDFRVIRPNGSVRWMATKTETITDREGRAQRVVGIVFDITARKRVEGALGSSQDRFRALAEAADGIVWTAQPDGTLDILTDPKGYAPFETPPHSWLGLVAEEDRERVRRAWQAAAEAGEGLALDCRLAGMENGGHLFLLRAIPVRSGNGEIREWLGLCRDIGKIGLGSTAAGGREQATGAQIRAARGILNWSVRELAEAADVSVSTIRRLEEFDGSPPSYEPKLAKVQEALEEAGIEFIFPSAGKPAVRPA